MSEATDPGFSSESEVDSVDEAAASPWQEPSCELGSEDVGGLEGEDETVKLPEVKFHIDVLHRNVIQLLERIDLGWSAPPAADVDALCSLARQLEQARLSDGPVNDLERLVATTQQLIMKTVNANTVMGEGECDEDYEPPSESEITAFLEAGEIESDNSSDAEAFSEGSLLCDRCLDPAPCRCGGANPCLCALCQRDLV
jgi:hypothetical protein